MSSDTPVGLTVILFGLLASGGAVWSGTRNPCMKWYDRMIRICGGGIIFLVLLLATSLVGKF